MTKESASISGDGNWSSLLKLRERLLGEQPCMTLPQLAEKTGYSAERVRTFWLVMGFPPPEDDQVLFTRQDGELFTSWCRQIDNQVVAPDTAISIARSISHLTDRMVLWQVEALVNDFATRLNLDDTAARMVVLDHIERGITNMEQALIYSWRRQMEALLSRIYEDISTLGVEDENRELPLQRTLGFVDMVSFTSTSSNLTGPELTRLVEGFEATCRNAIAQAGGRVVKTIGDAVMFIADSLEIGFHVVCEIMRAVSQKQNLLPARASLIQGQVISRSGDVFGPAVNLAARLCDQAPEGQIYTDEITARALLDTIEESACQLSLEGTMRLRGFGDVEVWNLDWSEA